MFKKLLIICCCWFFITGYSIAIADVQSNNAQWALGVGLSILDAPLYPGSSQNKIYTIPLPYVFYRSNSIEIDKGIQATLFRTSKIRINLSADIGVPVDSSSSDVREGMPNLDMVFQIGPSIEITLAGGRFEKSHTRLQFPFRAAIATDIRSVEHVGWVFEPRITFEFQRFKKVGFSYSLTSGLRFVTEKYNDYYYEVEPIFATENRSIFDAKGGYSGFFSDGIIYWRTKNLIYYTFLRYQNLNAVKFEDSPLVEQNNYFFIGAGVTWIFAKSL